MSSTTSLNPCLTPEPHLTDGETVRQAEEQLALPTQDKVQLPKLSFKAPAAFPGTACPRPFERPYLVHAVALIWATLLISFWPVKFNFGGLAPYRLRGQAAPEQAILAKETSPGAPSGPVFRMLGPQP